MGFFADDSQPAQAARDYKEFNKRPGKANYSNELIGGAAAFEAAKAYEEHVARKGKLPSHAAAKEFLAGIASAFVDRAVETRGLNFIDRKAAKRQAQGHLKDRLDQRQ